MAHANSIRALVKYIDADYLNIEQVRDLTIPSAIPLLYEFESDGSNPHTLRATGIASNRGIRGRYIMSTELLWQNGAAVSSIEGQNIDMLDDDDSSLECSVSYQKWKEIGH